MTERKKAAKEGGDSDPMKVMRERYAIATDNERDNRLLGKDDLLFVAVPGNQWDDKQKKARKNRPCYEFPILRSHWRQVVNDQKKTRPAIKVRAQRDATAEDAELRQGLIRNIESTCNAALAYDAAFELLVAAGMGAWRVRTKYSEDDGWEQDFVIEPIKDALASVWITDDGMDGFIEETISRDLFEARYPKARSSDFDSAIGASWFTKDGVRLAEWWRKVAVVKEICLLSDGRSVDAEEFDPIADEEALRGVECVKRRSVNTHKVVMSIVSGAEELDGPHDSVFHDLPIVLKYANRHYIDGKWHWMGMVRPSRDPQKLLNYNFTAGQEALAKQHKSTPLITPKMLEGEGVKAMWDSSNAADAPYLPYTPDPLAPGGKPDYLTAPPIHNGFVQMGQMSIDMLKASDGIYDASVGARSNETSGRAIMARQAEGDTATFDYQDILAEGIRYTGELIGKALHKVYDTPRVVRIIGKDGGEDWQKLYEETVDRQTGQKIVTNDLSAGKYDYTVTTGPSYDTQRMEFVDMLVQLSQGNPLIQQGVPDLIVGAMDFPKAEEAAERLKLLLPPQIQQAIGQGKEASPEVIQLQGQLQAVQQQATEHIQAMQQQMQQLQAKAQSKTDAVLREVNAAKDQDIARFDAITRRMALGVKVGEAERQFMLDHAQALHDASMDVAAHQQRDIHKAADLQHAANTQAADQQHQSAQAQFQAEQAEETSGDSAAQ